MSDHADSRAEIEIVEITLKLHFTKAFASCKFTRPFCDVFNFSSATRGHLPNW